MAEDRWFDVALPLLEELARREETESMVSIGDLADDTGLSPEAIDLELERLLSAEYVIGKLGRTMTGGDPRPWHLSNFALSERGARAVGVWPSDDPYEALLALLDRRIYDSEIDPETRSRLERFRGTLVDVGKGAAGGVLAALVRAGLGMG